MLQTLTADLRYAIRGLLSKPMFALVAIASLALGIGVNTAIFSLFEQVALRPLPVHEPDRLVNFAAPGLRSGSTSSGSAGGRDEIFSYPMLRDLQRESPPQLAGIAGFKGIGAVLRVNGQTRPTNAALVTGNYFDVLGLVPAAGRLLTPDDDRDTVSGGAAVLAHAFWRNDLGADPAVIGQAIDVNGQSMTIVGVAPPGFTGTSFGTRVGVFVPLALSPRVTPGMNFERDARNSWWIYLFGRLAPGADIAQAEQAINLPFARIIEEVELPLHSELDDVRRAEFARMRIELAPGPRGQSRTAVQATQPLAMLFGTAMLVLLIACLNIANLLLARGSARAAEFAVRASIGASRGRLLRQLLMESTLLAVLGGLASMPLAALAMAGISDWLPDDSLRQLDATLQPAALLFATATAAATVLLFGLFPALQLARTAPITALRGGSSTVSGRGGSRFRTVLATTQIGFSMAALVLAGLFAASLWNLAREDLGMQAESLAVFSIDADLYGYDDERSGQLFDRIEEELVALPGVTAVATSSVPFLTNNQWGTNVSVEGFEDAGETIYPDYSQVGVGFFSTMGIPLLAGRDFTLADNAGAARVAIVNRRFADHYGLGANPVGRRMSVGESDQLDIEIVGLVEDSKYHDVKLAPNPLFFTPRRQWRPDQMSFYVRSELPPATLLPLIPKLVATIDPDLVVDDLATVPQQIAETVAMERFVGVLSAAFAALSTLLAALGLYGVLSYTLSQRMRELGLRLALGAEPRRLANMVFAQLGRMTVVGGVLGLLAALLLGRAAQSLLFGLQGHDPRVLLAAGVLLALIALAAGLLPARRASRVDPMVALRYE